MNNPPRWFDKLCAALNIFALVALAGAFLYAMTLPNKWLAVIIAAFTVALVFVTAKIKD